MMSKNPSAPPRLCGIIYYGVQIPNRNRYRYRDRITRDACQIIAVHGQIQFLIIKRAGDFNCTLQQCFAQIATPHRFFNIEFAETHLDEGGPTSHKATKGRLIKNSPSIFLQMFRVKGETGFSELLSGYALIMNLFDQA